MNKKKKPTKKELEVENEKLKKYNEWIKNEILGEEIKKAPQNIEEPNHFDRLDI